ncbi:MAG: PilZ domain-containing protein [Candidatus Omnitrophota bacterium]|nr:MAG: PilZ domain-containing protein [Candidatus Omnitrophota bacterium]
MKKESFAGSDRRKHVRIVKALPLELSLLSKEYRAVSKNIGKGGVLLELEAPEEVILSNLRSKECKMGLSMNLPGCSLKIKAEAEPVWTDDKGVMVGVRFAKIADDAKGELASYIAEMELKHGIKSVLAEIARMDESEFDENTSIRDDLGIDSLMAMEILVAVEKTYNIKTDEAKMFDVVTVGDMIELIKEYLDKK